MSNNPIHDLRADDLGRFVLDLETPVEKTVGRMFGCFSKIAVVVASFMLLSLLSSDLGLLSKLAHIVGLVVVVGFFRQCQKNIDCYYVLDNVGGQLLYHFSAIMIVSEDPVANLEDVVGVGVTCGGGRAWALVFCHADGRIIRVSDFVETPEKLNSLAESVSELIKVPCLPARANERQVIVVENGSMKSKIDDALISSVSREKAAGCLMSLFVLPYAFYPALIMLMLPLMIIANAGTGRTIAYYSGHKSYGVVMPGQGEDAATQQQQPQSVPANAPGRMQKSAEKNAESAFLRFKEVTVEDGSIGTIIAGRGIIGIVEIGEEMQQVLPRFERPVPEIKMPAEVLPGKKKRGYAPVPEFRDYMFDRALSIVFKAGKNGVMRVARIEIFCGKTLPYITPDNSGFGASAAKVYGLGDGK
ncbi:MAG: hypothetical protein EOM80_19020, partial [Erysipelotrichia bacterium]|nr:hypothetical protein [Erysipelotrichia bacterium]